MALYSPAPSFSSSPWRSFRTWASQRRGSLFPLRKAGNRDPINTKISNDFQRISYDFIRKPAQRLAGVTVWIAVWWMTEAVPLGVTSLLPAFPLLCITPSSVVLPNYANKLIYLFFGGFQLAFAVERCGLHRCRPSALGGPRKSYFPGRIIGKSCEIL